MTATTTDAPPPASASKQDITVLLLCGGLSHPPLATALNAPLLSLPQTPDRSVLGCWIDAFTHAGLGIDRCRLLTNTDGSPGTMLTPDIETLPDSGPYRGPAGVVRDAVDHLDAQGCCLIIETSRMLSKPETLSGFIGACRNRKGTISVATNPDGSFSGLIAADTEAIRLIPGIGFIDIKEQWLPAVSREGFEIIPHMLDAPCYSIRTSKLYLEALRRMGRFDQASGTRVIGRGTHSIFGEPYGGSLIAKSAEIAPGAVVSCSAVGDGAVIESDAVVVRSIVGPRARIKKRELIIDSVVQTSDDLSEHRT